MNKKSKYYRLTPAKGKVGNVNNKVIENINFNTFRRFNSYNVPTKIAILEVIGNMKNNVSTDNVGHYTEAPGHYEVIKVRGRIIIIIWVEDPIDPRASLGNKINIKDYIPRISDVAVQRVNNKQQIMYLRGKKGLRLTLNIFG